MGNDTSKTMPAFPMKEGKEQPKLGDIVQIKKAGDKIFLWGICTQLVHEVVVVVREKPTDNPQWCIRELQLSKDLDYTINNSRDKVSAPREVKYIVARAQEAVGNGDDYCPSNPNHVNYSEFVEIMRYPKLEIDGRLDKNHCSKWFERDELPTFYWLLKKGDIVEFKRPIYSHFAVCVEEPLLYEDCQPLVHRTGSDSSSSGGSDIKRLVGKIQRTGFQVAIQNNRFRINNSNDRFLTPKSTDDICKFAIASIGSMAYGKYDLVKNNCWHFSTQVRYGADVRKNTMKCSDWITSGDELKSKLVIGDIVEYEKCNEDTQRKCGYAIYMGYWSEGRGVPEVAYRYPSNELREKAVVRTASLTELLESMAKNCKFRINNMLDNNYTPKGEQAIISFVRTKFGKEYQCLKCDHHSYACLHFVGNARYGTVFKNTYIENEPVRRLSD